MIDPDQRIGSVRDRLLERYLGFAFGGLHFQMRDISAQIAEARQMVVQVLGRELPPADRPNRFIHLSVVTDETDEIVGKGTFYWEGAAATWFWVDPASDLVFVGMTQRMFGNGQPAMNHYSRPTVYGALIEPRK